MTLGDERLPFKASALADPYDGIDRLPAVFVLEHVRSLYNVGAFFRTADAVRLEALRTQGFEIAVLDTVAPAIDLFDWQPRFPTCVVFGHEVDGVSEETLASADILVRIPMLGIKHSLNVATAGGVVAYELLRRRRQAARRGPS